MARPTKKYKSLDDEVNIVNEIVEDKPKIESENDILEHLNEDIIEESGESCDAPKQEKQYACKTQYPQRSWTDDVTLEFNTGDLIIFKKKNPTIMKIFGAGAIPNTYLVKFSKSDSFKEVSVDDVKLAPKDSIWINYWDTINDPYTAYKKKMEESKLLQTKVVNKKIKNKTETKTIKKVSKKYKKKK